MRSGNLYIIVALKSIMHVTKIHLCWIENHQLQCSLNCSRLDFLLKLCASGYMSLNKIVKIHGVAVAIFMAELRSDGIEQRNFRHWGVLFI